MRLPPRSTTPALLSAALLAACASFQRGPFDDGEKLERVRLEGLAGQGFCDVFLISGAGYRQDAYALTYNTTGLNAADPGQSCPPEAFARVDRTAVKDAFGVADVLKSGPRFWTVDWLEVPVGAQRDFSGLQARWFGVLRLPEAFDKKGSLDYVAVDAERDSRQGYRKGTRIYVLDDPRGTAWLLQSYTTAFDPNLTAEGLERLGEKLRLPPGWKFRTRVLEEDLEVRALNGRVQVMQDNLQNTYVACFSMSGQQACSARP
jgi:hypothetical protein